MRFLVSLISDETWIEQATPEQFQAMVAEMDEFIEVMEKEGVYAGGEGLGPHDDARTLRYGKDGEIVVTDGPFAESKEQVAGYMILEVDDMDEAIEWVKKIPNADPGSGAVEIRPIFDTAEEVAEAYKEKTAS